MQRKSASRVMKTGAVASTKKHTVTKLANLLDYKNLNLPANYDIDATRPNIHESVFGNDRYEDCVIAARANHTLRLDYQPGLIITDDEVISEYREENMDQNDGVFDDSRGLVLRDSLSRWKQQGWTTAGVKRQVGDFHAVDWTNRAEMQSTLFADVGIQVIVVLPQGLTTEGNYGPGHLWNNISQPGIMQHCVLLTAYSPSSIFAITWGVQQEMSWDFLTDYGLEAYGIVANVAALDRARLKLAGSRRTLP